MARTPQVPDESVAAAVELREAAKSIPDYRRAIATLLFAHENNNLTAEEIANLFGVSRATIFANLSIIRNLDNSSPVSLLTGSGGRHNSYLSHEQEALFLKNWGQKSKDGLILSIPILHASFNELISDEVSKTTV